MKYFGVFKHFFRFFGNVLFSVRFDWVVAGLHYSFFAFHGHAVLPPCAISGVCAVSWKQMQ